MQWSGSCFFFLTIYSTGAILAFNPGFIARDWFHGRAPVIVAVVVAQFLGKFRYPTADEVCRHNQTGRTNEFLNCRTRCRNSSGVNLGKRGPFISFIHLSTMGESISGPITSKLGSIATLEGD